jgi:hypothetical protein
MEEMMEKLVNLTNKFNSDEKVINLVTELESRFKELMSTEFTEEDVMSEEFEEMVEEYTDGCRESDPDEVTYFDVLWFTA